VAAPRAYTTTYWTENSYSSILRFQGILNRILEIFSKKLGSGGTIKFWQHKWVGLAPLCDIFPQLFNVSLQLKLTMKEMGVWEGDNWYWRLTWRRNFLGARIV
jgi:hypothetical protein